MNIGDLIWFFLLFSMVQPLLQRRLLDFTRARRIAMLERMRGSRVILLVHRQEQMRLLGFPLVRYIDINDSEEVLAAIHQTANDVPLDIVLHTPGGLAVASTQIARALSQHPAKVTVFVPHYAMSGGTLIALAADQVVMSPHAILGPIDPQIEGMPAASILRAVARKPVAEVDDKTLVLADLAEKAIAQLRAEAARLLGSHMPPEQANAVATTLSEGRWTHDYPISPDEARDLGLPVGTDMPEEVLELMTLFPAPKQQSAVSWIPGPRQRDVPQPRP
ncbi:MAG: ATP-dependent Clp protease proteolytic subunit [Alphaproteobacteria bacterium]|nr:ATP-dependent Clp protease proteolytic subunit [Alphaproteobacteria bacterium]